MLRLGIPLCLAAGLACIQAPPSGSDQDDGVPTVPRRPNQPLPRLDRPPPADVSSSVDALLNAYEHPGTEDAWRRLGPAARPRLVEVLQAEEEFSLRRARAAEALGYVGGPEEIALLQRFLETPANPGTARMGAITGLGRALGEEAVPLVAPYLEDSDSAVRARAAQVLAAIGTPQARDALEDRARLAPPGERDSLQRLLPSP